MVYKMAKLKDGRTATLDWLKKEDLPEVVEALNSVIREGKYLFTNNEITDMEKSVDGLNAARRRECFT